MMAAFIKTKAGLLATALALAELPIAKQTKNAAALGAVHLSGDGERLHVATTGAAGTFTTSVDAEATGEMALPLQKLAALAATFPADAMIAVRADDNAAGVAWGRSTFKLPVLPIADLPARHVLGHETGCVQLDAATVRDLLSRPAFAIETEQTRYYLGGIFLRNIDGELVAVGTDGRRLARLSTAASSTLSDDRKLIIPREILRTIQRLLSKATGSITLRRSERLLSIEGATFRLVTRLIDAEYPDTARLIPNGYPNTVTTNLARLNASLERFTTIAQDPAHAVQLSWNGGGGLRLNAADTSSDDLAADVTGTANVWAQVRYLRDLLQAMRGTTITIAAGGVSDPILFSDPDDSGFRAVQMPIREGGG